MINIYELLKDLVACPSISPEDAGTQDILLAYLKAWDYQIHLIPSLAAKNFWAAPEGNPQPRFVFAGHTDVVSVGSLSDWLTPPFELTLIEDRLYGRGVADMKGSLAAFMVAMEKYRIDYPECANEIGLLITSAEEGPSEQGTPLVLDYLATQGIHFQWCLVGEPTSEKTIGDTIKNGRRGSLSCELEIIGKQSHIAYPHLASNPIHHALPFLTELTQMTWDQGTAYFQPTQCQISNIHAGTGAGNVIPQQITVMFNFRYSPVMSAAILMTRVEDLLCKHDVQYRLTWAHYGEPFFTKPDKLVTAMVQAIEKAGGISPLLSTTGGTSDGRYIAKTGAEVIEFGLINETIHQVNEMITMTDLSALSDIYYHFLVYLLAHPIN